LPEPTKAEEDAMWIMLNDCFFSIVDKDCKRDELMVRARRPGDIEKVFETVCPGITVTEYTASDYHYRAAIKKDVLKAALCGEIDRVSYSNFKNSVDDKPLHDAYLKVWHAMAALQPQRPYAGSRRLSQPSLDFGHETAPAKPGKPKNAKKAK
jgi:hypothetical protein